MKLQRWKIKLNEYNFSISYVKGKDNNVADGLSRLPIRNINDDRIENKYGSDNATLLSLTNDISVESIAVFHNGNDNKIISTVQRT